MRENGGQYTHAATWVVLALARLGRGDDAWKAFQMLNPVNHALDREAAEHYRVEPYVVAADIYGEGPLTGRGGWTWYTGSAAWLYRAAVEGILGVTVEGDRLIVRPVMPQGWNGFEAKLKIAGRVHAISVSRDAKIVANRSSASIILSQKTRMKGFCCPSRVDPKTGAGFVPQGQSRLFAYLAGSVRVDIRSWGRGSEP